MTDADCPKRCLGGMNPGGPCMTSGDCPLGKCAGKCDTATLGPEPFYKLSSEWGTAKVRGPQIRPGTTYRVQTQADVAGGSMLSSATTAATWKWGDVKHDDVVDALDIAAIVDAFRGIFVRATFEAANLWGCTPDALIDALDIAKDVDAFKGVAFSCAPPTCGTSNVPPRNPYRFTGKRLDFDVRRSDGVPVLTLYHFDRREYDARHGRFLQRDPAGYADGANLYEYARSNPGTYVDPDGLGTDDIMALQIIGDVGGKSAEELKKLGWMSLAEVAQVRHLPGS